MPYFNTDRFLENPHFEVSGCKGITIVSEEAMKVVMRDGGDYIHVVHGTATVEVIL